MYHVLEHVASIERNHWNEVGESQKDVDPHDPEEQIDKEEKAFFSEQAAHQTIIGLEHCFFCWCHRHPLRFEWQNHDL